MTNDEQNAAGKAMDAIKTDMDERSERIVKAIEVATRGLQDFVTQAGAYGIGNAAREGVNSTVGVIH